MAPRTKKEKEPSGDAVSKALFGMDINKLYKVAKANKLGEQMGEPTEADHPGRYRMRLGNFLRGKVRRGEPVKVGGEAIEAL